MTYKIVIPGRLPGLNELINESRRNRYAGNTMKRDAEFLVKLVARKLPTLKPPCDFVFDWVEKDKRRDKDNISSGGRKIIFDSLVKLGKLENDGWGQIGNYADRFHVDKKEPRVVVTIIDKEGEE